MTTVIVRDLSNRQVATVSWDAEGRPAVSTDDHAVRDVINSAIEVGNERGLAYRTHRRVKTTHGFKYELLGRWVKPSSEEFPQALADYLARENLIAYPEDEDEE